MKATVWVLLAVVVLGGAGWMVVVREGRTRENGVAAAAIGSAVVAVQLRDIGASVLVTGVVRPKVGAEVKVGSRVSGVLSELGVTVGDRVRAGDLLAVLDPAEYLARRDQVAAQLETARAALDFDTRTWERGRLLLAADALTAVDLEGFERAVQTGAARVRELQAALAQAEIQLAYTRVVAPIGGVVSAVTTQVGETVAASFAAPTFVTIVDLDRLEVWAYVDETDIGRIQPGQSATFTVDTYPDTRFSAKVTAIRPTAEIVDNVVNYVTLLDLSDHHGLTLRPEMTTRVEILIEGRQGVPALPTGALRQDQGGAFVFKPGPDGPVRTAVVTGFRGRDYIEVLEGLSVGDQIIVGGGNQ